MRNIIYNIDDDFLQIFYFPMIYGHNQSTFTLINCKVVPLFAELYIILYKIEITHQNTISLIDWLRNSTDRVSKTCLFGLQLHWGEKMESFLNNVYNMNSIPYYSNFRWYTCKDINMMYCWQWYDGLQKINESNRNIMSYVWKTQP